MKQKGKQYTALRLSFVFIIIALSVQSCDLIPKEESFQNPYTEQTEQVFGEMTESVFTSINENIRYKAYGTVTHEDIMRYANEGYRQWALKNGAAEGAFMAGAAAARDLETFKLKSSASGSSSISVATYLDSLMTELDLSDEQKQFILELPHLVTESGNIVNLEKKLRKFDNMVYDKLGEKDSDVVLHMSAIIQASMGFITTDSKLLVTLIELIEESNEQQSYFYQPDLTLETGSFINLAQSQEGPSDPPRWEDYFDSRTAGFAIIGGGIVGTYTGAKWGAAAGALGGPWGAGIGGAIGGLLGFGIGTAGGYGAYKGESIRQFEYAVEKWCNETESGNHPDYGYYCGAG